ncbi:hypothetical protein C2E21_6092 [Chlorella sorokiniana]|uniref:Uncharacterized protein n=1 Tax=Chlorella sorokiniana TaxID=3076 RepID=A0A2P6TMQ1_CHLSO|nr:hypothetical protein C2E21_6092 [Chlorella sorokiniana]|eukprot:PRW45614.1 hypothetical protein C2E21_6092 [Chlorella sorokiniana]
MLERMQLPRFNLPFLSSGGSNRGRSRGASAAARLQSRLPTLQRAPQRWRELLVHAIDLQKEIDTLQPPPGLTGRWRKCKESSDSMTDAFEMVELPWLFRKAVAVLNVLELEDTADHFSTTLKAGGIMDVVEKYPWNGETVDHPRRDKRKGRHRAHVARSEAGEPCIICEWEDPFGGRCTDTFSLSNCGLVLTQTTDMSIKATGRRTLYKTVYHRIHQQ